jgi:hypothetical protein
MATTLERASFGNPISGWIKVKFDNPAGIAAGNTLTFTKADGAILTGTVTRLLSSSSAYVNVLTSNRPSGVLLLPKGTAVA